MELPKLQPMQVGQIVAKSCRLYFNNFWWFLGMSILLSLPLMAARLVFDSYGLTGAADSIADWESLLFEIAPVVVVRTLGTFVSFLLNIAIFTKISAHYLNAHISFWQAYKRAWLRCGPVLMVSIVFTVIFLPATFLQMLERLGPELGLFSVIASSGVTLAVMLVVLLVMLWFVVTPQCIAAENLSAWQSMKRSMSLVRGNLGRVIGLIALLILVFIGFFIVAWLANLILTALWRHIFPEFPLTRNFKLTLLGILYSPVGAAANSLLYYDLRARKESSEAETIEGFVGAGQTQSKKPRISRLAIASIVLGLSALISAVCKSWGLPALILSSVLSLYTFWGIPGLILGISAIIAIQSKKGLLRGRMLALVGIGISCLAIYLSYGQVIRFFYTPKAQPCDAAEVLRDAQLAGLPSSATSVQAAGWVLLDEAEQYLMFQAIAEDIEKFVAESEGIRDREPEVFDSNNMYLPRKYRSDFKDKEEWQKYSRHEQFYRGRSWPDWYDPTIRLKGRKYEFSVFTDDRLEDWVESNDGIPENFTWGTVVINDETNTVYIRVRW